MITTELYKGQGLGNQLACYITTRVLALDKGYDFGIESPHRFKGTHFMSLDFGLPVRGGKGPEGGPPLILPHTIKHYYRERKILHPVNGSDIRLYDKYLRNIPDHTKIDGLMQGEGYFAHRKDEIREWLKVSDAYDCYDYTDDNTCVINFRGGEYARHPEFFLRKEYWENAIAHMRGINPHFRFIVITDDVLTAKTFFPDFDVFHFSIGKDYSIIKNAHYLILSNSSFAWFPAWLSTSLKYCLAPKYWARHNISDGYWSLGQNITKGWNYMDRDGIVADYNACMKEWNEYKEHHKEYFAEPSIKNNFLVVSNFNNDLRWVPQYTNNYVIYDRSDTVEIGESIDKSKIKKSPNIGYNLYDYFTFIIDHYDNLPDCTIFTKGNIFPRHVLKEYFDRVINNEYFTSIEDPSMYRERWPISFRAADGGYCEINNSWYTKHHPTKYFRSYNDFMSFCFKNPTVPRYTRFSPGANYIVPKAQILKYPLTFYKNLRLFISHCPLPGEAHIIERALHTIWSSNFEINPQMLQDFDENVSLPKKDIRSILKEKLSPEAKQFIKWGINTFKNIITTLRRPFDRIEEQKRKKAWLSKLELENYRKTIKVYDTFNFFNELELLDIRLNMLDPYVDYFVLVESTTTHSGLPTQLYYQNNKHLFKKFEHKIKHIVIDKPLKDFEDVRERLTNPDLSEIDREILTNALTTDTIKGGLSFLRDFYQKEYIKKALIDLNDDDFCFISDLDEIWDPRVLIDYSKDDIYKLKQEPYMYYLNNRSNEDWSGWTGTIATKYKNIKTNCLNHIRTRGKVPHTVIKSGWHFSFLGGADRVKKKIESYGHQEINTDRVKNDIANKIANNKDIREKGLKFWIDESSLHPIILNFKEKYKNLFKNN
jgi:hypothetical protein